METQAIIDVLRQFGVKQCKRVTTDYGHREDSDQVTGTVWTVESGHFPPAMNCSNNTFNDIKLVSWRTDNDLPATSERRIYVPTIDKEMLTYGLEEFLCRYMMTTRSVPLGFCSADGWRKCSFHTPEFFKRKLNELTNYYQWSSELVKNEKVCHLRDLWFHASPEERETLKNDISKIAKVMTKRTQIMLE